MTKSDEMSWTCITHEWEKKCIKVLAKKPERKRSLGRHRVKAKLSLRLIKHHAMNMYEGADGRILKWILKKQVESLWYVFV
jgi:hypothetical protein